MKRLILILIILLLMGGGIIYLNHTQGTKNQLFSISGTTMGTSYHLKLVPEPGKNLDTATLRKKIDLRLSEIDQKMSTYKQDSDISRFNRYADDQWMPITSETLTVVTMAQRISRLSNGAFDITVGHLVNLWGFGPTVHLDAIPDKSSIKTLLSQVGYRKLELRQTPPALRKANKNIYLDLSAIAKGYAVDAVAQLLIDNKIDNFLVEIGGEIITHGEKHDHQSWVVGIESPISSQHTVQKRLHLYNVAMATSGDYRNYFEEQGVRYSHTIDPATGYPIKHKLASVTVIDSTCMSADALATAIMVMGPEKGMAFAEQQQLAIFMLVKQGDHFTEMHSSAFIPYLKGQKE